MAADDIANIGFSVETGPLDKAERKLDSLERKTRSFGETGSRNINKAGKSFESFSTRANRALSNVGRRMAQFTTQAAKVGAVVGAAGLAGSLFQSVRAFADFERQMIEVGKTTDLQGRQLDRLGERIQMIAREVPISTSRLQGLAVAAGQLGVKGVENVAAFTETLGKLETATDLAGEEGARSLARLLNITGRSQQEISNLGSAITALGNNFATTEQEITRTTTFLAGATSAYGVTAEQVLGLSAALRDLGQRAETSGSSVGAALQAINTGIAEGGEQLRMLTDLLGVTAEQLRTDFAENATEVLLDFAEALSGLSAAEQVRVLEEFGLAGRETIRVLNAIISNTDRVRQAVDMSNEEWQKNTALNIEAARAAESFSAQMQFLGNALNEAAVEIGRELAPLILELAEDMRDFIQQASDSGQIKRFFGEVAEAARTVRDVLAEAAQFIGLLADFKDIALGIVGIKDPVIVQAARKVFGGGEGGSDFTGEGGIVDEFGRVRLPGGRGGTGGVDVPFRRGDGTNDGGPGAGGAGGTGEASRAEKERVEELRRLTAELNAEERERNEAIKDVTRSLETEVERVNRIADENREIIKLVKDQEERKELFARNERQRQEELARIREANASEFEKILDNAAENVQRAFGDVFTDIFRHGVSSFEDLFDRIKDIAARAAGEIAAIFAQRAVGNILVSIAGGASGEGGGLGGVIGSVGKALGGGQGFGLGDIPGVGGIAASVGDSVAEALGFSVGEGAASLTSQLGAKLGFRGDIIATNPALKGAATAGEPIGVLPGTLSGAIGAAAGGFGGFKLGGMIGQRFGGETGGEIGGAFGGAVGSIGGPIGTLLGSAAGSFFGSGLDRLISGGSSTAERATGLLDVAFPGIGSLISGVFGIGDQSAPRLAALTRAEGRGGPFKGAPTQTPFGFVGFSQAASETAGTDLSDSDLDKFEALIKGVDEQVAKFLTDKQVEAVTEALQQRTGSRGVKGGGIRTRVGGEKDIGRIMADRFGTIFEAIGEEIPEALKRSIQDAKNLTPQQAIEQGLAPLQELFTQRIEEITTAIDRITRDLTGRAQELLQFRDRVTGAQRQIGDFLFGLQAGPDSVASPTNQLTAARGRFEDVLAEARLGDPRALQNVTGAAGTFLDIARRNFASSPEFFERQQFVQQALAGLQGQLQQRETQINETLSTLNIEVAEGNAQRFAQLDTLITEIKGLREELTEQRDELERLSS